MFKEQSLIEQFTHAQAVCEAIHGNDAFTIVCFKRSVIAGDRCYQPQGFTHNAFDAQLTHFPQYANEEVEPFLMVGCTDGEGFSNANVTHTWALAVDFDGDYPRFLMDNPLVQPSLLIETSPDRYHAVWVLDQDIDIGTAKMALTAITMRLGGDAAFAKPSQLVRLPGFKNVKRGFVARLVEQAYPITFNYNLSNLLAAFDVDLVRKSMRKVMPRFSAQLELPRETLNKSSSP